VHQEWMDLIVSIVNKNSSNKKRTIVPNLLVDTTQRAVVHWDHGHAARNGLESVSLSQLLHH
jgi:hypothetical protein